MQKATGLRSIISNQKGRTATGRKAARQMVLLCTTARLPPQANEQLSRILAGAIDWRYLTQLAAFQGVLPLVTHNLMAGGLLSQVPEPFGNGLKRAYDYTMYRNIMLSGELAGVLSALRQRGIETVCLKGTALAEVLYGDSCLRPVADMDLLIHPEDKLAAAGVVAELGYQQLTLPRVINHPFHREYCREAAFPMFLELHWHLDDQKLVAFPEEEMWHRTQPLELQGATARMLSPEDNLLFLANHLYKHDSQWLKLLCDIAELLKKYRETLDWAYITSSASSWQIKPAAYLALKRANGLLGAPVPADRLAALKPPVGRRFLLDLVAGEESFVSQSKETKLLTETSALAHALMMRGPSEMVAVLSSHRSPWKPWAWVKAAFWATVVSAVCLGRYLMRLAVRTGRDSW